MMIYKMHHKPMLEKIHPFLQMQLNPVMAGMSLSGLIIQLNTMEIFQLVEDRYQVMVVLLKFPQNPGWISREMLILQQIRVISDCCCSIQKILSFRMPV